MPDFEAVPSQLQVLADTADLVPGANTKVIDVLKDLRSDVKSGGSGSGGGITLPISMNDVTGLNTALGQKAVASEVATQFAAFDTDLTAAETKLTGIAPNATANRSDTETDVLINARAALVGARFTGRVSNVPTAIVDATPNIDGSKGNYFTWLIAGNRAPTTSNIVSGTSYSIEITQDATGSRIVTWPASFKWPGGIVPTLSTAANAVDVLSLITFDGTLFRAVLTKDFK